MSYAVLLSRRAARELEALAADVIRRIDAHLAALAENPRPHGCKKLRTPDGDGWRIRVGEYRILYTVDDSQRVVRVYHVGHRRDVYD